MIPAKPSLLAVGRHIVGALLCGFCLAATGCGGGGGNPTDAPSALDNLLYSFPSLMVSDEDFQSIIASDSTVSVEDRTEYEKYSYTPMPNPEMDGETATVKVDVYENQKVLGTMDWIAVKEGDQWKFKSMPLPSGS
ncbi:MAG: hypothetical protein WDZ59_05435 [Pirellulales bacterium]